MDGGGAVCAVGAGVAVFSGVLEGHPVSSRHSPAITRRYSRKIGR